MSDQSSSPNTSSAVSRSSSGRFAWYIVNVYAGFEQKVAATILQDAKRKGLEHKFEQVIVPVENVMEFKKGKKVNTEKTFFPGYVLVKMELDDHSWHFVRGIPKVAGFLGNKGKPQPISEREVALIQQQMQEGFSKTHSTVYFEVGETIHIIDGPFATFMGLVEEVDMDKSRLKVAVSIFGRSTPVELDFSQVEKRS